MKDDSEHANQLYLALKNGIAKFPGCERLLGIRIERSQVEPLRVEQTERVASAFYDAICKRLSAGDPPDLAFVIYSKEPTLDAESDPYPAAKAAFALHGVPSQYVSWELLNSEQQFKYAVSNVALSCFVKLGGVPWGVKQARGAPTLVIGIGHAEFTDPNAGGRQRLAGFATSVLSNGVYVQTEFFPPSARYDEFIGTLRNGLAGALSAALSSTGSVERVTFHISQLEKREMTVAIRDTIAKYENETGNPIPFEIVRLNQHSDFVVYDFSDPGYVSEEGTVVMLGNERSLLVTEGRRERDVWRGRKPVAVELQRTYCSSPMEMRSTIEDAFALSSVNWRGFNAVTQPVTLQYAGLLASLVGKMSRYLPEIGNLMTSKKEFHRVPWFI